jgi:xanthine dehydrogenase small subunit
MTKTLAEKTCTPCRDGIPPLTHNEGKQHRKPGEFVRRLLMPKLPPATHQAISAVLAAFYRKVDGGRISDAKVAFGGMAGIPKRAKTVGENLRGLSLGDARRRQLAADAVKKDFTPLTDLRASTTYRSRVAGDLVIKALAEIAGISSDVARIADRRMVADAAK